MEDFLILDMSLSQPPLPPPARGARAALGTAAGLGVGALAAAAWARLEYGVWDPNKLTTREHRLKIAGMLVAGSILGTSMGARAGTRAKAVTGAIIGNVVAQIPALLDPALIRNNPIIGNIWQFGLPLAGAVIAVNLDHA